MATAKRRITGRLLAASLSGAAIAAAVATIVALHAQRRKPLHRTGWYAYRALMAMEPGGSHAMLAPQIGPVRQALIRSYKLFGGAPGRAFVVVVNGSVFRFPPNPCEVGLWFRGQPSLHFASNVVYRLPGQPWPAAGAAGVGRAQFVPEWKPEPAGVTYLKLRQNILARSIAIFGLAGDFLDAYCVPAGAAAVKISTGRSSVVSHI